MPAVMPAGAQVLSVGPPRNGTQELAAELDLWAVVDPSAATSPRHFRVVGTGHPMPDDCGRFVGTTVTHGGALVWHVFEAAVT